MHAYHVIDTTHKQFKIHFKVILTHNYNSKKSEFNNFKQTYDFELNELKTAPSMVKFCGTFLFNVPNY